MVRTRAVSPVELTRACLDRIERHDPALNAFITVTAEAALAQARQAEAEVMQGAWRGPLHGVPIALKDLVDTAGALTTGASGVFVDRIPERDAEVTRRLRQAGAVLLGKLNLHELAYGASSVVSRFGPVRNPWSSRHTAGGSSSGSAVALAAGMCFGAIGSDTGGSIRQPAAFNNVIGLKPAYGRVSLRGVIPLSISNDHVGPMARTPLDAALMLQVLAGPDPEDPICLELEVPDYAAALGSTSTLRLGIPRAHFYEGVDPEVGAALAAALAVLAELTSSQREVSVPAYDDNTVFRAEIYAYHRDRVARAPELFQPDTLHRILSGADVDTATYLAKRHELEQLRQTADALFSEADLFVTPTSAAVAFDVAGPPRGFDELRAIELTTLRNTRPFNALALPALSVPCGFTAAGLPIGMQIVGPRGGEGRVLALAQAYHRRSSWHERRPLLD